MVRAVELGFDLFSGSYPYLATRRGEALLFEHIPDEHSVKSARSNFKEDKQDEENGEVEDGAPQKKRRRVSASHSDLQEPSCAIAIDLNSKM